MKADQLHSFRATAGELREESLALLLKEALDEPKETLQTALLKRIGDISLYKAGFFQDSLNRKLVDVDYYIDMGGAAYRQVEGRAEEEVLRTIYHELGEKFSAFVDILSEVSEKTSQKTEKDILRTYEIWLKTRSERSAKILQDAGIFPNQTLKKD